MTLVLLSLPRPLSLSRSFSPFLSLSLSLSNVCLSPPCPPLSLVRVRVCVFCFASNAIRAQGTKSSWENRGFMGPAQWERVTEAFENDFDSCDVVMFGTPTPLVFLSQT